MPKIIITPWRDASELVEVRSQFYPSSSSSSSSPDVRDLRPDACRTVRIIWRRTQGVDAADWLLEREGEKSRSKHGNYEVISLTPWKLQLYWRMPSCTMTPSAILCLPSGLLMRLPFLGNFLQFYSVFFFWEEGKENLLWAQIRHRLGRHKTRRTARDHVQSRLHDRPAPLICRIATWGGASWAAVFGPVKELYQSCVGMVVELLLGEDWFSFSDVKGEGWRFERWFEDTSKGHIATAAAAASAITTVGLFGRSA